MVHASCCASHLALADDHGFGFPYGLQLLPVSLLSLPSTLPLLVLKSFSIFQLFAADEVMCDVMLVSIM